MALRMLLSGMTSPDTAAGAAGALGPVEVGAAFPKSSSVGRKSSPRPGCSHASSFLLRATPACRTDRSRCLATTFRSSAATVPLGDHRDGVNAPGLLCQPSSEPDEQPVRPSAPPPISRLTPVRSVSSPKTRCCLSSPSVASYLRISTPLRGPNPSGSLCSTRFEPARLTSPESPIVLRSLFRLLF